MVESDKRRNYPRRKLGGIIDLFCYRAGEGSGPQSRENLGVAVLDISQGGARLRVSKPLSSGDRVAVELRDPVSGESFRAHGEVRWSSPQRALSGMVHVAGVQFREVYTPLGKRDSFTPNAGRAPESGTREQRQATRFKVGEVVVNCVRRRLGVQGLRKNLALRLQDLSERGLRLSLVEPVEPGTPVSLTLHFSAFADSVDAEGEVRWCRKSGNENHAGVWFIDLPEANRKKIEFARKLLKK